MNEVKFFFTRAGVGVGLPFGLGEDLSQAAIWLACCGEDPGTTAAPALAALSHAASATKLIVEETSGHIRFMGEGEQPVSALYAGPSLGDWLGVAAAAGSAVSGELYNVDQPLLVVGYVGAAGLTGTTRLSWETSEGHSLTATIHADGTGQIDGQHGNFAPGGAAVMTIAFTPVETHAERRHTRPGETGTGRLVAEGIEVADEDWSVIYDYFCKCLVPSSAQSREQGAGAGLTDND